MSDKMIFLSSKDFKSAAKESESLENTAVRKQYIPEKIKQVGGNSSRSFRFIISSDTVDRDLDTVASDGWDLKHFKKNSVVLFAHDSRRPPIGRASKIKVEDGKLKATVEFMDNEVDTSGFSDMIFRMVRGGFLKATSVGFLPKKFEFVDQDNTDRGGESWFPGIDFIEQELLEFSIVPVPSNPDALLEASAKGIDTRPLCAWLGDALEEWAEWEGKILVPRKKIEELYQSLKTKKTKVFHLSKQDQAQLAAKNLLAIRNDDNNISGLDVPEIFGRVQVEQDDGSVIKVFGRDKKLRGTDVEAGHNHQYDDGKSGITGPASDGEDPHDHAYTFGDEKTAPGGKDSHTHGLPEFQDEPEVEELHSDLDSLENKEEKEIEISKSETSIIETKTNVSEQIEEEKVLSKKDGHDDDEDEDEDEEEGKELDLEPIKLKIRTDGTVNGTKLIDIDSGRVIETHSVNFEIDIPGKRAVVSIILLEAIIELQFSDDGDSEISDIGEQTLEFKATVGEKVTISPLEDKSKVLEADIQIEDVLDALKPPQNVDPEPSDKDLSDDDLLDIVKEVLPDLLKGIIQEEIGRARGKLD